MNCPDCGTYLPDHFNFCYKCGAKKPKEGEGDLLKNQVGFQAALPAQRKPELSRLSAARRYIMVLILIGFAFYYGFQFMGKETLKNQLLKDWQTTSIENGLLFTSILDFRVAEVDYNFKSLLSEGNIARMDYRIVSPHEIDVDQSGTFYTYQIEFNEEKTMMTITPGLTSGEEFERWYVMK